MQFQPLKKNLHFYLGHLTDTHPNDVYWTV